MCTVKFDDEAVADYCDDQVDAGLKPEQFMRIWLHTHPVMSPEPSGVDETTFRRVFGNCDWAVMFILARQGDVYCRLRFNTGPGMSREIETQIDFSQAFPASAELTWEAEYQKNVDDVDYGRGFVSTHGIDRPRRHITRGFVDPREDDGKSEFDDIDMFGAPDPFDEEAEAYREAYEIVFNDDLFADDDDLVERAMRLDIQSQG